MKKNIYSLVICLIAVSCKTPHRVTYNKQMEKAFIDDFKITYFKKLLLAGYNQSDAVKSLIRSDQSGFGEIILSPDDYNMLDSIVRIDNAIMVKDSLNGNRRAEGTQGKRVLGYALKQYESKWLDSLAKVRYYIYKKAEDAAGF
jgi:hypothetical protein